MGRYIKGDIDETLNLTTLGAGTLVSTQFDNVVDDRTLVSSILSSWSLDDFTVGSGIGPVMCGVAHSDYTDAEIQAVIDATESWNESDLVAKEVANRKVRRIGVFQSPAAAGFISLNDGKPIKTKLNWSLAEGQTLRLWAFNMGTVAIGTTVPTLHAQGHANLWKR